MTFALRPAAGWVANVKSTPLAVVRRRIPPLAATHASHEAGNLDRYPASDKGPRAVNVPQPHWPFAAAPHKLAAEVDLPAAWWRLAVAVLLGTILGVGMWSVVVALPAVQAEFGVARGDASLPYTLAMLGFGGGAVLIGRLSDRFGIVAPVICGDARRSASASSLSGLAPNLVLFALAHLLIGFGSSARFAPLIADISHWFTRRRGIAVGDRRSGQLSGRHDLAAGRAARRSKRTAGARRRSRSACSASLAMLPLRCCCCGARRAHDRDRRRRAPGRDGARHFAQRVDGAAVPRRAVVLRRHVDAAGAYRRLLRRSRLRRGARRRDAVR